MFTPHSWTNGIDVLVNAHLTAGAGDAPFLEDLSTFRNAARPGAIFH
jgi:hypothetical protein